MSIRRLLVSYTLAAIAIHAAVAAALFAFPMTGRAETIPASSVQQQPLPESIDVSELPEVLQNPMWEKVRAFKGTPFTTNLMPKIENAVNGLDSHFIQKWSTVPDGNHDSRMLVESDNAVARSTLSEAISTSATEKVRSQTQSTVYRVSEGHLEVGTTPHFTDSDPPTIAQVSEPLVLISKVAPLSSPDARRLRNHGAVVLEALIRTDGTVHINRVVRSLDGNFGEMCRRGFAEGKMARLDNSADYCPETLGLNDNAIALLKQWRFRTATKNDVAVPIRLHIEMNYNMR